MQKVQRFVADQRFDLPQYESMMNLISAEFNAYNLAFMAPLNYVVSNWKIEDAGGLSVRVNVGSDSFLFNSERTGFEEVQYRAAGMAPLTVLLQPNSTNYVEIQLAPSTTGNDAVALWDATANSGAGGEFIQNVDTVDCQEPTLVSNTIGFSVGNGARMKLAVVVTGAGSITSITDQRRLYFSHQTDFNFGSVGSRIDTAITSMKSNDEAIKTILKEMKGTANWMDFQGATTFNLLERMNYILVDGGYVSWTLPKGAVGSLTAIPSDPERSIKNSDTFTLAGTTFVFKTDGTTPSHVVTVPVNGTVSQVKTAIITAINAAAIGITASSGAGARIVLTNTTPGTAGNVLITESISFGQTLSPVGMAGGVSSSALTWTANLRVIAPSRAFVYTISAQTVASMADGDCAYVTLPAEGVTPSGPLAVSKTPASSFVMDQFNTRGYIIAYRSGSRIYFGNGFQTINLDDGETNTLGDGVANELLTAIGVPNEFTSIPPWESNYWIGSGASIVHGVSQLDTVVETIWGMVTGKVYDETLTSDGSGAFAATALVPLPPAFGIGSAQTYQTGYNQLQIFFNGRKAQQGAGADWLEDANVGAGIGNRIQLLKTLPIDTKLTFRIQTGGGQSGAVSTASPDIFDEGVLVVSQAASINFKGAAVVVSSPGANLADVTIRYPRELAKAHKNGTGSTIPAFTVVAWQDNGTVTPAEADVSALSDLAGLTAAAIAPGAFGIVIKLGNVPGALAGLGAVPGARVYLSDTAGTLSLTAPPGLTDSLILMGRAEPADGVASASANDLWLAPEIISGG